MTKAEERALEFYPMKDYNKEPNYIHSCDSKMLDEVYREVFMIGYEQAEKDLTFMARVSSGPDGFYYGKGYEQAKKDLGWISVDDCLPEVDEEVIVLTDDLGTAPIYKIAFGHIVNKERCVDYNGWNIPGVKYWMPMPKLPKEEQK